MLSSKWDIVMALLWETVLAQTSSDTLVVCRIDPRSKAVAVVIWSGKGGARKTIDGRPVARVQRVEQIHDAMNRGTAVKLFNAKLARIGCKPQAAEPQSLSFAESRSAEQKVGPCLGFRSACVVL